MKAPELDWRWGTAEGSRDFDRLMDPLFTLREKIQWIEEIETLHAKSSGKRIEGLHKENANRGAKS